MPKLSAGILLYRIQNKHLKVLLVHPGGPFWAKKDLGSWSVPKGEYTDNEEPLVAAKREFQEETGFQPPASKLIELGEVAYSNKKLIVWALEGDIDAKKIMSETFSIEWPPKSGKQQTFPEVDRADWFDTSTAQEKLVNGQRILITRLAKKLGVTLPAVEPPSSTITGQIPLF